MRWNENGEIDLNGHKLRGNGEALEEGEGQTDQGIIIHQTLKSNVVHYKAAVSKTIHYYSQINLNVS